MEQTFMREEKSIVIAGTSGTRLGAAWTAAILDRSLGARFTIAPISIGAGGQVPAADILVVTSLRTDELPAGTSRETAASNLRALVERAGTAVVANGADPVAVGLAALAARVPVHVTGSLDSEPLVQIRGDRLALHHPNGGNAVLPVAGLHLASRAYIPVAATSIAAALLCGARLDSVGAIGDSAVGADAGLVLLGERRAVRWLVDAGATSPGRALPGIEAAPRGRTLLLAGGEHGGQPLGRWGDAVGATRYVLLYGSAADAFADAARGRTTIVRCADLNDAVSTASRLARRGDSVVYAPGCLPEHGTARFEAERFAEAALGASLLVAA